ncbi:MAG: hypothetical protein ACI83D_000585 [Planctomycetota bacterium]
MVVSISVAYAIVGTGALFTMYPDTAYDY